ncbi:MAG: NADH:flavin oxidoreductase/NADH oxidase [Burkholderiaceae bacterium]|nr:NADH:flavin oxidoreductase/NADH oxidase [Burkholderiaceae bacterium]
MTAGDAFASVDRRTPLLFTPLELRGVTARNRVMVSPMVQYCAQDGFVGDWHFAHLARMAMGGAGIVFMEATKVEHRGMGSVGDAGIWSDEHVAPLRRITAFLREQGALSGIQLNHSGRKAGVMRPWEGFGPLDRTVPVEGRAHWEVIGPSPISAHEGWPVPREMSLADIQAVIAAWGHAARRACAAGFDIVEIHGAHGYLIHQFLSPAANRRADAYGGSFERRIRFAVEVCESVRAHWPQDRPLFFRISAQDEAGWSLDDSVALARVLKRAGVDLIDCSSGGIGLRSPTADAAARRLGFQVPFAARIRRDCALMTAAVGLIVEPQQAETILREGSADAVAMARELLYNPNWPLHAARELGLDDPFGLIAARAGWWLERRAGAGIRRD